MPRRRLNRWPLPRPYLAAVPGAVLTAALALLLPMAPAPAWSETNKAEARDGFVTLTPQAALPLALGGRQLGCVEQQDGDLVGETLADLVGILPVLGAKPLLDPLNQLQAGLHAQVGPDQRLLQILG